MRVSYTSLGVAALLSLAACSTNSTEIVAPEATSANTVTGDGAGPGQIGSGNFTSAAGGGIGQFGSGNAIADSTVTPSSTTERGIGQFGSGN
jgi:hypothetical protein